jgi:hypothetical protein
VGPKLTGPELQALHRTYCDIVGIELTWQPEFERDWYEWARRGFTTDDLRCVVQHRRRTTTDPSILGKLLRVGHIIGQIDRFAEDLAAEKARLRPRPPRTQTVRTGSTERIIDANNFEHRARTPAQELAALQLSGPAAAQWEAMKAELGLQAQHPS